MEQNEKQEMPEWVKEIDNLLPSARQTVGTIAANTIQNLGFLYEVSESLYNSVLLAVETEIMAVENADSFVDSIVKDAKDGKL